MRIAAMIPLCLALIFAQGCHQHCTQLGYYWSQQQNDMLYGCLQYACDDGYEGGLGYDAERGGRCVPLGTAQPRANSAVAHAARPSAAPQAVAARVWSDAPGASVSVDGQQVGASPWFGSLPPGRHQIRIDAQGYRTMERPVDVDSGDGTVDVAFRQPRPGQLAIGLFTLGLGVQGSLFNIGDTMTELDNAGASFLLRPLFAVVRAPVLLDVGLEVASGYMSAPSSLTWDRDARSYQVDDAVDQLQTSKLLQVGLYLGLGIPLLVRERPLLYLTINTTQGIQIFPLHYYMNVAVGLSYFASDRLELRFELVSLQLRGVAVDGASYTDVEGEQIDMGVTFWLMSLTPTFAMHIRF